MQKEYTYGKLLVQVVKEYTKRTYPNEYTGGQPRRGNNKIRDKAGATRLGRRDK